MDYKIAQNQAGQAYLKVRLSGYALIAHPLLNKGMAFSEQEREAFHLMGLLPPHVADLATQRERSYQAVMSKTSDIEKYIYLRELQDSNETLFYSLLLTHLEELLPIVYTPTVGLGCQRYSHVYRRPRGLFIAYPYRHCLNQILANPHFDHVQVIVVSDGERILGLGDQGAGGMGIPIGKLALYTACAGLDPASQLPILLDTGTNNVSLRQDPLYIGWQHERIRGQAYDDFLEEFIQAIQKRFPHVLLQWEDFAQINAEPLLTRYRHRLCTFNDDIQGTAAVAAGTLFAAMRVTGLALEQQRIVVVGAGSAGCGISQLILQAMIDAGIAPSEARKKFFLVDRQGLLLENMPQLLSFQRTFAQPQAILHNWNANRDQAISLLTVIKNVRPTLLIGVSAQARIFTEEIVREMAAHVKQPIIFPLSNPPSFCEAIPEDLMKWTEGRAIIGTGSPFPPLKKNGSFFRIDQTNNCYIFPGMGLGLIAVKAKEVSNAMFMAAAHALSESSPARFDPTANLLPPLSSIRDVSLKVATAVAQEAINSGLAQYKPRNEDLVSFIEQQMWSPKYLAYKKV